jgi:phage shock protein E
MLNFIKKIFGKDDTDYKTLVSQGAIIVDVRSVGEFNGGHIAGAINIPVDTLAKNLGKLKDKNQVIITCCASGMRSGAAKSLLESNGYTNVYNGGGWAGLRSKI